MPFVPWVPTQTVVTDALAPTGDTTGAADWLNIQSLVNSLPAGSSLLLGAGVFWVNAPIEPPTAISIQGQMGSMQGGAGSPGTTAGTVVKVATGFAQGAADANAVFVLGKAPRQDVRKLWIDGNSNTGTTIDGINWFSSGNGGMSVEEVGINNMSGWGVNCPTTALGSILDTMVIQGCTLGGYNGHMPDSYLHNVHAQNNTASGVNGIECHAGNFRAVACRGDGNGGNGFLVSPFAATTGLGVGAELTNCGTENNTQNGALCTSGGTNTAGPIIINGGLYTGDGQNGGSGGGGFAGIKCTGRVTVTINGAEICLGGAVAAPQYALATGTNASSAVPDLVQATSGAWQAVTALINDAGPATKLIVSPAVSGVVGNITGTSGTTTFVQPGSAGFTPANPTATASTTLVMMGLGSTCQYTPQGTGKFIVTATGYATTATAAVTFTVGVRQGVVSGQATTVAAGSNGAAAISTIASWAQPSAGVLDVASTAGFAASGTIWVTTSGANQPAQISYTSITGGGTPSFNGCAFVAGTGANTVATGNSVTGYPQNGAAVVGTRWGAAGDPQPKAGGVSSALPVPFTGLLALTAGTTYWIDYALDTSAGADAAALSNVGITITPAPS